MARPALALLVLLGTLPACKGAVLHMSGGGDDGDDCSDPEDDPDCPQPPALVAASCFTCGNGEGPRATAVGGTQGVTAVGAGGVPLTAITAASDGSALAIDDVAGTSFVLAGRSLGTSTITVVDTADNLPPLAIPLETATLSSVTLVPSTGEVSDGGVAFAAGALTVGLTTLGSDAMGSPTLMADDSLAVTGWPDATQPTWDSLHGSATVGTYMLAVTSGAETVQVPLVVVDHADAIVAMDAPVEPGAVAVLCFEATSGGLDVAGLTWTFAFASQPAGSTLSASPEFPNCAEAFVPMPSATQLAITASAGGATVTQVYAYD